MNDSLLVLTLASVVAGSAPLVFAGIGETLTEKSGVINLSLDGSILLSAMVGFATAYLTDNVALGFLAASCVGASVALLIAFSSIVLRQDQVAIGLVLTMFCAELANFMGNPYVRKPGPSVPHWAIPVLSDLPIVGPILFNHNVVVYLSMICIVVAWLWAYKTQPGLRLQAVGERPEAAYVRGADVNRTRYLYTAIGGALVGVAGATYSLSVKLGWSHRHTAGFGWIALAIVIFGGWHPVRVAFGAYLFGFLKSLGSIFQTRIPGVPTQVFQVAPFALMILALLLVSSDALDRLLLLVPARYRNPARRALHGSPPGALGTAFERD
jgi:simple sugar transport system permease protein